MDTTTKQIVLANYGNLKLARYLVRSYDDLADVCQTVARQVLNSSEPEQVFKLFNAIDCICTNVPNTLSSLILGFRVPERILLMQNYGSRPVRNPELRVPPTQAPKYDCRSGKTMFWLQVNCFFDLYLLHRFIREAMNLTSEGMKLIKSKRSAELRHFASAGSSPGFGFKITFPCECDLEVLVQLETQFLRKALTGS